MNNIGKNKRVDLILQEIKETDSVLNLGCTGYDYIETNLCIHDLLCKKAKRVVGVDLCPPDKATEYDIVIGNVESLDLDEKFDVIVAGEIIEHLSNPGTFLEGTKNCLKQNSTLLLTTPNPWDWTRFLRAVLGRPSTPIKDHVSWYDTETITNLAECHGFKLEQVEHLPRVPYGNTSQQFIERLVCIISQVLYILGFKKISSMGVFYKLRLEKKSITYEKIQNKKECDFLVK